MQRSDEDSEKTTRRIGDRFVTGLLWKDDNTEFPDKYPVTVRMRLRKNPKLYTDYLVKSYAHEATMSKVLALEVWYTSLHLVYNPRKKKSKHKGSCSKTFF